MNKGISPMTPLPIPDEPLRLALIGAGQRAQTIYLPLWESLKPWCQAVAVCDPVKENCDKLAAALGVTAYGDIRQLVRDTPMEAAVVVTPVESHHSISVFLSANGIHNHTETTWASMVCQAKEMIDTARRHKVVVRAAENFFRMPIDRFAQTVRNHGYLGRIGRVVSYADHTGYHNNSRCIAFARSHPAWVQCVEHEMGHPADDPRSRAVGPLHIGCRRRPPPYHGADQVRRRLLPGGVPSTLRGRPG
jgi:predicted dehydrogenase